jgi:hypothetical protein
MYQIKGLHSKNVQPFLSEFMAIAEDIELEADQDTGLAADWGQHTGAYQVGLVPGKAVEHMAAACSSAR